MIGYCNPRENIRQILRGVIIDLLVFGDAFIEVVWLGQQPVALYTLDCPSMMPIADEHGNVTSYVQITDAGSARCSSRARSSTSLDAPLLERVRRVADAGRNAPDHRLAVRRRHFERDLP